MEEKYKIFIFKNKILAFSILKFVLVYIQIESCYIGHNIWPSIKYIETDFSVSLTFFNKICRDNIKLSLS